MDPHLTLKSHLLELLRELEGQTIRPILAGGFGLFLKRTQRVEEVIAGAITLFDSIPEARSTQDIDLFLRIELFLSANQELAFLGALERLGYIPVTKFFQFAKPIPSFGRFNDIKIDCLVRSPLPHEERLLRRKAPRLGSQTDARLHGREVEEAFAVEESPRDIMIEGLLTTGKRYKGTVHLPHPFAWLVMKFVAAGDSSDRGPKGKFRHAFDAYVLISMLTQSEYSECQAFVAKFRDHPGFLRAKEFARKLFLEPDAYGIRAIRAEAGDQPLELDRFKAALKELFDFAS